MYCKHCGSRIDDDSKFCNHCGKVPSSEAENTPSLQQTLPSYVRTPLKTSSVYNQKTIGTWQKLTYVVFGVWLLSVLMVLADWFVLDAFGYAEYNFNLLQMEELQSSIYELTGDEVSGFLDNVIALVFGIYFAIFVLITVILFIKRMRGAFITGIIASLVPVVMAVLVMVSASDIDTHESWLGCSMELTAVPYIMIIANVIAMVILLIARSSHVNEHGKTYRSTQGSVESRLSVAIMIYTIFMGILSVAVGIGDVSEFSAWSLFALIFGIGAAACAIFSDRKYRQTDSVYIYFFTAAILSILMAFALMSASDAAAPPATEYYEGVAMEPVGTDGGATSMMLIYLLPLLFMNFMFIRNVKQTLTREVVERVILVLHGAAILLTLVMVFGSKEGVSVFHICYLIAVLGAAGYSGFVYYQKRRLDGVCIKILGAVMLASAVDMIFFMVKGDCYNTLAVIALVFCGILLFVLEKRLSVNAKAE